MLNNDLTRQLGDSDKANPAKAAGWHHAEGSAFIRRAYAGRMAMPMTDPNETVVFLAGGGGSGKSMVSEDHALGKTAYTVLDDALSEAEQAMEDIDLALASGRKVEVDYIYRGVEEVVNDTIARAHLSKFGRGRIIGLDVLANDHEKSPQTVLAILDKFGLEDPRVHVSVFDHSGGFQKACKVVDPKTFLEGLPEGIEVAEKIARVPLRPRRGDMTTAAQDPPSSQKPGNPSTSPTPPSKETWKPGDPALPWTPEERAELHRLMLEALNSPRQD